MGVPYTSCNRSSVNTCRGPGSITTASRHGRLRPYLLEGLALESGLRAIDAALEEAEGSCRLAHSA